MRWGGGTHRLSWALAAAAHAFPDTQSSEQLHARQTAAVSDGRGQEPPPFSAAAPAATTARRCAAGARCRHGAVLLVGGPAAVPGPSPGGRSAAAVGLLPGRPAPHLPPPVCVHGVWGGAQCACTCFWFSVCVREVGHGAGNDEDRESGTAVAVHLRQGHLAPAGTRHTCTRPSDSPQPRCTASHPAPLNSRLNYPARGERRHQPAAPARRAPPAARAAQDEMRALQRLNSLYFMSGYLGFLSTWIMDLIVM